MCRPMHSKTHCSHTIWLSHWEILALSTWKLLMHRKASLVLKSYIGPISKSFENLWLLKESCHEGWACSCWLMYGWWCSQVAKGSYVYTNESFFISEWPLPGIQNPFPGLISSLRTLYSLHAGTPFWRLIGKSLSITEAVWAILPAK